MDPAIPKTTLAWRERVESHRRFLRELAKQPTISDEDFMAEFGASDEEYAAGLVLPGAGREHKNNDD